VAERKGNEHEVISGTLLCLLFFLLPGGVGLCLRSFFFFFFFFLSDSPCGAAEVGIGEVDVGPGVVFFAFFSSGFQRDVEMK